MIKELKMLKVKMDWRVDPILKKKKKKRPCKILMF